MNLISAGLQQRLLQSLPPSGDLKLQNGQLLTGKVLELYPNQRALLQIGMHKTLAAVEAPLVKGAEYVFEASVSAQNSIPGLKIVSTYRTGREEISHVTAGGGGLTSKTLSDISGWLLKANIPFTAANAAAASEWLITIPEDQQPAGKLAAGEAIARNLPLDSRTLSAIFEALKGGRTADELQELIRMLPANDQGNTALRKTAQHILDLPEKTEAARMFEAAAETAGKGSGQDRELARSAVLKMQDPVQALEILRSLKNSGAHPLLTEEESLLLLRKAEGSETAASTKDLVRLFSALEKILIPLSGTSNRVPDQEAAFGRLLSQAAETGGPAGEKAEQLLLKLEGRQLLQTDQPGTFSVWHHYPIKEDRILTDLSVHYQLRKDSKEKIDPAFCRLVFYLSLANLGPVMADVQIQNRIVSASVYSEKDLSSFSSAAASVLKKQFEELPFHFSGISFKYAEQPKGASVYSAPRKGFDFKI